MAKRIPNNPEESKLSDSDTSEEDTTPQHFKTTPKEREYRMVPGSATATAAALSHTRAQHNPTVKRGPEKKRKTKVKKLPKEKATDKQMQTPPANKDK